MDAKTPPPDLTPDDLARIEELWRSTGIIDNDDMRALAAAVRSRDERIAELEAVIERQNDWSAKLIDQSNRVRSELAARNTELVGNE